MTFSNVRSKLGSMISEVPDWSLIKVIKKKNHKSKYGGCAFFAHNLDRFNAYGY